MSILIAAAAGAGRCFGWQPLAKVSMMIMRPTPRSSRQGVPAASDYLYPDYPARG